MLDLTPAATPAGARQQAQEFHSGIISEGITYRDSVAPEMNGTYAMRVVAYRVGEDVFNRTLWKDPHEPRLFVKFYAAQYEDRRDLLIVFKIIRIGERGDLTIVWRELRRQASPKLTFTKNDPPADIL